MDEIKLECGATVHVGDEAYDYYSRAKVLIVEPSCFVGWYDVTDGNGRTYELDGSRMCSIAHATRRGWL